MCESDNHHCEPLGQSHPGTLGGTAEYPSEFSHLRSEAMSYVSINLCCHSLRAVSSDIKCWAPMACPVWAKNAWVMRKFFRQNAVCVCHKCHQWVRRSEVRAKGLAMGPSLLKIRWCYSHYTKIMSGKSFICYTLKLTEHLPTSFPWWTELGAGGMWEKETFPISEDSPSSIMQSSPSMVAYVFLSLLSHGLN